VTRGPDDVRRLIGQGWDLPDGPGQIAAAEEAVRHADAVGDDGLAFDARMLATSAYHRGGEPAKSFVTFSWCLSAFDADPGGHDAADDRLLRWFFKYVVSSLPKFPEIPLERTAAVLDDMERRYRTGGHSLHAVYNLRWLLARHVGDEAAADEWYDRWCAAPRDENSDCAGCDPTERVMHLCDRGRYAEAVALAEPVLAGRLTCSEQPHSMLTELLVPYLRTDRLDQAREAHRRAYRAQRGNVANMVDVATHLVFCALTGNDARGLEIVQRHLDWLDRPPSPYASMEFASAAGLVLRRLTDAGHGDLTVHRRPAAGGNDGGPDRGRDAAGGNDGGPHRGRDAAGGNDGGPHRERDAAGGNDGGPHRGRDAAGGAQSGDEVRVADLAGALADRATHLAGRFDARNGGTHQSERIAARLAAEPIVEHLPLSATARRRTPVRPAGTADAAPAAAESPAAARPADDPEIPAAAGPEELLDLAERYGRTDRGAAARAVLRVFDERYAEQELSPLLAARRADGRGNDLAESRDVAGAEQAWQKAVDGYRSAGDELRAQVALGRLGVLLCLTERADEGLPLVVGSREHVLAHGSAERRAGAHARLGIALVAAGRPAEALPELDLAAGLAAEAGDPHLTADVALRRAHCLAGLDRPEDFRAAAGHARDLYRELGGSGLAVACLLHGSSFDPGEEGEGELALGAFDEAVAAAPSGRPSIDPRLARARALCSLDRPEDAIDDFVEVVGLCTELELADGASFSRFELANAYRQAGRMLEAAEVGEEAVVALSALGAQEAADRCRYMLSSVYRELGEDDAAITLLDQLAANLDGYDNLPARGQMHEEAGDLLYRLDRDATAADRFRAAAEAFAAAGLLMDELRARRRHALALRWSGDLRRALTALHEADAAAGALPADVARQPQAAWERAMLGYDATKILIGADRLDDALPRIVGVPHQLRQIEAFGEAFLAELLLGELLLRMDRPVEAEPVLRGVLSGLPRDAEALPQAAWLLSQAMSMQGRDDEAKSLRAEYGIDEDEDPPEDEPD
jgi:tetratricopeptide (TPR) repeat protein